eukprot:CCRYP_018652-RA/>CCRYP_018652-RA protein AED:0.38 eAED:0.38 QI:1770/0/0.5/1/0/0/2/0/90
MGVRLHKSSWEGSRVLQPLPFYGIGMLGEDLGECSLRCILIWIQTERERGGIEKDDELQNYQRTILKKAQHDDQTYTSRKRRTMPGFLDE